MLLTDTGCSLVEGLPITRLNCMQSELVTWRCVMLRLFAEPFKVCTQTQLQLNYLRCNLIQGPDLWLL